MNKLVSIEFRPEQPGDEAAIYQVIADAFRGHPYAAGDEQDLVDRLRELGQLALSVVAMDGDRLVGQISFSPATLSDGSKPRFGLGCGRQHELPIPACRRLAATLRSGEKPGVWGRAPGAERQGGVGT